jgi:acetyl-CoA carboxylase biotin carboxyl carrier protein
MTTETIEAPMPGVFYRRPEPDEDVFVEEGDTVEAGDPVCMIGVMKNFHKIQAESGGTVAEIPVENEAEVDAGDALVRIDSE